MSCRSTFSIFHLTNYINAEYIKTIIVFVVRVAISVIRNILSSNTITFFEIKYKKILSFSSKAS